MGQTRMLHQVRKMLALLRACALGLALMFIAVSASPAAGETISLALGSGSVFTLERPFETVLIDDAGVVAIHTKDDRSVILEAIKPGRSTIVFVDTRHIAIANIRVVVSEPGI